MLNFKKISIMQEENINYHYNNMQYKIPVQIENEDKIILGLSIRQIFIMLIWWAIAYSIIKNGEPYLWKDLSIVLWAIFALIWAAIALWNVYEMTFVPFMLNLFRLMLNSKERIWRNWVDSYPDIEIWFVETYTTKEKMESKHAWEAYESIENKLKNI